MTDTIDQRARELAVYIIENGATVRSAASHFGISKSTVHKDLQQNKQERHIRGGLATRYKYKGY